MWCFWINNDSAPVVQTLHMLSTILTVFGRNKDVIEPFSDAFVVLSGNCLLVFFQLLLRRRCCRCRHHCLNSVVVHHHYLLCIVSAPHCSKSARWSNSDALFVFALSQITSRVREREKRTNLPKNVHHKLVCTYKMHSLLLCLFCSKIIFQSSFMTLWFVSFICRSRTTLHKFSLCQWISLYVSVDVSSVQFLLRWMKKINSKMKMNCIRTSFMCGCTQHLLC